MRIALLHRPSVFFDELLRRLVERLSAHDVIAWHMGQPAPAGDIEVVLAAGKLTRADIEGLGQLAFVQATTAGFEDIDVASASANGIWVANAPAGETGNAVSVAEHAVFLMLAAARNIDRALATMREPGLPLERINSALSGKTACILGLGGIGSALVERLRPFGMTLVATNQHASGAPHDVRVYSPSELRTAVADAHFVIVCIPATKDNEHLIDARVLAAMKRSAILINVARGSLVDENALRDAIESGRLAGAGLDVLEHEPATRDDPLVAAPHVFATPHIAGATDLMLAGTVAYIGQAIDDFAAGIKPKALLDVPEHPRRALSDR